MRTPLTPLTPYSQDEELQFIKPFIRNNGKELFPDIPLKSL